MQKLQRWLFLLFLGLGVSLSGETVKSVSPENSQIPKIRQAFEEVFHVYPEDRAAFQTRMKDFLKQEDATTLKKVSETYLNRDRYDTLLPFYGVLGTFQALIAAGDPQEINPVTAKLPPGALRTRIFDLLAVYTEKPELAKQLPPGYFQAAGMALAMMVDDAKQGERFTRLKPFGGAVADEQLLVLMQAFIHDIFGIDYPGASGIADLAILFRSFQDDARFFRVIQALGEKNYAEARKFNTDLLHTASVPETIRRLKLFEVSIDVWASLNGSPEWLNLFAPHLRYHDGRLWCPGTPVAADDLELAATFRLGKPSGNVPVEAMLVWQVMTGGNTHWDPVFRVFQVRDEETPFTSTERRRWSMYRAG